MKRKAVRVAVLVMAAVVLVAAVGETARRRSKKSRSRKRGKEVPTTIAEDTTLKAGMMYTLKDRCVVEEGATLTIEPRVRIQCEADAALEVEGTLIARGAPRQQIRFAASGRRDWGGILITSSKGSSELVWCMFANADVAVRVSEGTAHVESCLFRSNQIGLQIGASQSKPTDTKVTVTNCEFSMNKEYGIRIANQSPTIQRSTFRMNRRAGIYIEFGDQPKISGCLITKNARAGIQAGDIRDRRRRDDNDDDSDAEEYKVQVTATGCNIYDNGKSGKYDVYNGTIGDWVCTDNYWGRKSLRELKAEDGDLPNVYDRKDDDELGSVKVRPFKEKPYKERMPAEIGSDLTGRKPIVKKKPAKPVEKKNEDKE